MIIENLDKTVEQVLSFTKTRDISGFFPAERLGLGIPTLEKAKFRDFSPMLKVRFEKFGRWTDATHGTWLSLSDMEAIWDKGGADRFLKEVYENLDALGKNWPNHASGLFRPDRLSLFAGSDLGNESILLLWLDFEDEPELWVYDSNGESRYKDFNEYLVAYINDDLTASERSWRA